MKQAGVDSIEQRETRHGGRRAKGRVAERLADGRTTKLKTPGRSRARGQLWTDGRVVVPRRVRGRRKGSCVVGQQGSR